MSDNSQTPPPAYNPQPTPPQPYGQPAQQPYAVAPQYGQPQQYAQGPRTNVLAIVSLIAAFFIPIAAIITGHIALSQIRRTGEAGTGLAKAGLILGYVFTALTVLFVIVYVVIIAAVVGGSGYSGSVNS